MEKFQVVPPCGGHPIPIGFSWMVAVSFKSCPRVGGIHPIEQKEQKPAPFQVVPPCGGHPLSFDNDGLINMFQVVPPCGGHRWNNGLQRYPNKVSSRAPVWGASSAIVNTPLLLLFQVVPPCGGHRGSKLFPWSPQGFKSCPRVGGIPEPQVDWRELGSFKSCPRVGGIPFLVWIRQKF